MLQFVQQSWSSQCESELMPFSSQKTELSVHDVCLVWGTRVVIPSQVREMVLQELYQGHLEMSRMKSLAAMYVGGQVLTKTYSVCACQECQANQPVLPSAPLHPWSWPTPRWSRLHIDYAGPFQGNMLLVVIDTNSKWIKTFPGQSATSKITIDKVRSLSRVAGDHCVTHRFLLCQ